VPAWADPWFWSGPRCSSSVFFFQPEDVIRDFHVTGVQTCALPISPWAYNVAVKHNFWGLPELIASLPAVPLYLLLAAATFALLLVSWRVSVWLYSRKSF